MEGHAVRTHQQKFMDDIEKIVFEDGLEVAVDYKYSNQGRLVISFEGEYEPIVDLTFEFYFGGHDSYAIFYGLLNAERVAQRENLLDAGKPDPGMKWLREWYLSPSELPKLLLAIRTECAKALNARRQAEIHEAMQP